MHQIDYFFSVISPFTYLVGDRVDKIADHYQANIVYKPIDVIALFARTGGLPVKDRHRSRQEYRAQDIIRQAKKAGLPFNLQPAFWPANQAPASYAFIAAQHAGGGNLGKLVHIMTRACWAEERNIADDAVIGDCLAAAGFDPALSQSGMLQGAEQYVQNLEQAVDTGVFGAPFFIVDTGQRFWGQDRLDDLEAHLAGAF